MKPTYNRLAAAFLILTVSLLTGGCMKDKVTRTYTIMTPVYSTWDDVLSNIKSNAPQSLKAPGKIYMYGSYLYINEVNKGVHVIDNSDPTNPQQVAFIEIPGNIDIAVRSNFLYADLYTELITIDITDPSDAKLVSRVRNVFPERQYGQQFVYDSTKVVVDWLQKDTTVDGEVGPIGLECRNCLMLSDASFNSQKNGAFVPGIAGSMARFAIVDSYLYAVNFHSLNVIDLNSGFQPQLLGTRYIGMSIETIYPFRDRLFIGSSSGMFTFNINDPVNPQPLGMFTHARACDPVAANDDFAFVTLRSGSFCQGTNNQLDVIDVSNLSSPSLIKTYEMYNPFGLAIDGTSLFVCDGKQGLKVYDASNVRDLHLIDHLQGIEAYDVIAWNKRLIVVAQNGLFQFDYSNPSDLKLLSTVAINR